MGTAVQRGMLRPRAEGAEPLCQPVHLWQPVHRRGEPTEEVAARRAMGRSMLEGSAVLNTRAGAARATMTTMAAKIRRPFDPEAFLDATGVPTTVVAYDRGESIYVQGATCDAVMYVKKGEVKLSVVSKTGREAIVAILGAGNFFGEGALAGQPIRIGSATAHTPSTVISIEKAEMRRLLHEEHELSDGFIAHLLTRNVRIEEDLIDQLFNSAEKRLARTLLLLARYGEEHTPQRVIPRISQETLAEMVGTTRSRVNFFMNRFKKLGFISVDGGLTVNNSLLSVVLHD